MELTDLSDAKAFAESEKWDQCLLDYNREVQGEEEIGTDQSDPEDQGSDGGKLRDDPWDTALATPASQGEPFGAGIPYDYGMETDTLDDDGPETESAYEEQGETYYRQETGELKRGLGKLLRGKGKDVTAITDRKLKIDLSFINNQQAINRSRDIIRTVIKTFSSVPGRVEVSETSESGVFVFNVTNANLSPDSDTSSDAKEPHQRPNEVPAAKLKSPVKMIESLIKGIQLIPKFTGLPSKTLKYGEYELTPERLGKIQTEHPGISEKEAILLGLKLSGQLKKIKNLYKFPPDL